MVKSAWKILCLTVGALVSGCASTPAPYTAPPGQSLALTVARAAGLVGLKDADVPMDRSVNPGSGVPLVGTLPGAAAYGALSALSPPPGFGAGAAGALGFAAMVFSGPTAESVSQSSQVLAWAPRSFAPDAATAQAKLNALIARELDAVLAEVPMPPGYRIEKAVEQKTRYRPSGGLFPDLFPDGFEATHTDFTVTGGECTDRKVICRYSVNAGTPPVEGMAPAVLGGYPAWTWTRGKGLPTIPGTVFDGRGLVKTHRPLLPDLDVYRRLSERLPEWVYLYMAPYRVSYWNQAAGKHLFLTYPFVFNRGTAHFFARGS